MEAGNPLIVFLISKRGNREWGYTSFYPLRLSICFWSYLTTAIKGKYIWWMGWGTCSRYCMIILTAFWLCRQWQNYDKRTNILQNSTRVIKGTLHHHSKPGLRIVYINIKLLFRTITNLNVLNTANTYNHNYTKYYKYTMQLLVH